MNYWKLKDKEIEDLFDQREGITAVQNEDGKFNRKESIERLVMYDAIKGELTKSMVIDDNGAKPVPKNLPFVVIKFHHQEGGLKYVPVGLNDRDYMFPRERWVRMPKELLTILEHAVSYETKQKPGKDGKMVTYTTPVKRYSYEIKHPEY